MKLIVDFYKGLDTLNLIIFWGIIIVIILLLVFSFIMMNKNKKLKRIVEQKNTPKNEEIPIKKDNTIEQKETIVNSINYNEEAVPSLEKSNKEEILSEKEINIETENNFVVEEHIIEYNQEKEPQPKDNNILENNDINNKSHGKIEIEIPNKPYQRNVLREMSLSQTSPIGINKQTNQENKVVRMAKDLENSLNQENINETTIEEKIKEDLQKIESLSQRETEIIEEANEEEDIHKELNKPVEKINITEEILNRYKREKELKKEQELKKEIELRKEAELRKEVELRKVQEQQKINELKKEKSESEKYLEEVSRKLAEAEIPDEIERTNYELQQEEDAIISYKELMEKKDSIQTIDEEDAVISIEELLERKNKKEDKEEHDDKLYKLSEEEENDNFINELKQFRNDL